MSTAGSEIKRRVQAHIAEMEAKGLDLHEGDEVWRNDNEGHRRKYVEFSIRFRTGDAQIDDWFPLLEDGLVDTDIDEHYIYIAAWILA